MNLLLNITQQRFDKSRARRTSVKLSIFNQLRYTVRQTEQKICLRPVPNVVHHIMKTLILIAFIFSATISSGQQKRPEDFGFRYLRMVYKGDTVDILIKSKKGEERNPKPLFLFCQGSLPQPLIKYDEKGMFGVFTFNPDSLAVNFHLAIIGKPNIPVVAHIKTLEKDYTYKDSSGAFPKAYTERNYLDYYVDRNINVIKFLQNQKWISNKTLVVAGHSEGSTIAAKLAFVSPKVTHLIYSGGNPMGRILTIIEQLRAIETDSTMDAEGQFDKSLISSSKHEQHIFNQQLFGA